MKIQTVNVVEYFSDTIQSIHSFSDDAEGNAEAEKLFSEIAKENGFSDEDVAAGLEDGWLDTSGTNYNLYIAHAFSNIYKED
jgi:hypothetical protein